MSSWRQTIVEECVNLVVGRHGAVGTPRPTGPMAFEQHGATATQFDLGIAHGGQIRTNRRSLNKTALEHEKHSLRQINPGLRNRAASPDKNVI